MKRSFVVVVSAVLCALSTSSIARERPPVDSFYDSAARSNVARAISSRTRALVGAGHIAHEEPRLGVPTFFWAAKTPGTSLRAAGLSTEQAARRYLYNYADLYRISPNQLAEAKLEKLHQGDQGPLIASFRAEVRGVPVFRDSLKVLMNEDLQLVALTGFLSPHIATAMRAPTIGFPLEARTAFANAYADLTGVAASAGAVVAGEALSGGYQGGIL